MEKRKGRATCGRLAGLSLLALAALLLAGCRSTQEPGFEDIPNLPRTPIGTGAAGEPPSNSSAIASPATPVDSAHFSSTNTVAGRDANSIEVIRPGELLHIAFSDTLAALPPMDEKVREDGTITLMFNENFHAAGLTPGDLAKEIRKRYVPDYYAQLTASVTRLEVLRTIFVDGEVRNPSKQQYTGPITVTQAIASAGGFTDFANKTNVKLIRSNGKIETVNCKKALKNPKLDLEVFPGDKVHVQRSLLG